MYTVRREAFWIGQYPIYWYGIIIAASVLMAIIIASREAKRLNLPQDTVLDFSLIGVPLAVLTARLYYVAFEWEMVSGNLWRIFAVWEGGIAMYGSLIGGAIAVFIMKKWRKVPFGSLADAIAPGLVLAQALGRWGNFVNQEAFGPPSGAGAQWFPLSVYIERTGQWHLATFFYESVWCLAVFLILWLFIRKRAYVKGQTFAFYMLLYAGGRSLIEGLRTDSLYFGIVRVSQLGSVLIMLIVCGLFLVERRKKGIARKRDWIMLGCAVLLSAIGVISQNAMLTDVAAVNWLGSFVCAIGIMVFAVCIWYVPPPDSEGNPTLKIIRESGTTADDKDG